MTSSYPDVSERLGHVFAQWQVIMMTSELMSHLPGHSEGLTPQEVKACAQWDTFPDHVLDNTKEFSLSDWLVPGSLNGDTIGGYLSLPTELFHWNRSSRRVFSIPHELQVLFGAAEFPDMQWKDVLWPHDCFVLSLESPLCFFDPEGEEREYDTILILHSGDEGVVVRVFDKPEHDSEAIRIGPNVVRNFRKKVGRQQYEDADKIIKKKQRRLAGIYSVYPGAVHTVFKHLGGGESPVRIEPSDIYYSEEANRMQVGRTDLRNWVDQIQQGERVTPWEQVDDDTRYGFEVLSVATKVAVSWMLYLESLPSSSIQAKPFRKERSTPRRSGAAGIITQPERLFEIIGRGSICAGRKADEEGPRNTKGFVRPHWRRAHYKRPRGAPPGAAKTVRVPAVLVRPDLVPLYGIIGGTTTVMIPEKQV